MAQYPGVPWNQRPDYLALTQRVDPAGIVTSYSMTRVQYQADFVADSYQDPPRPGVSATDITSFVYGLAASAAKYV